MIMKQNIESQLHCKATAELVESINQDLLKSDGSLKDLINDTEYTNESNDSDRNSNKQQ
jgi:hypothetical protein